MGLLAVRLLAAGGCSNVFLKKKHCLFLAPNLLPIFKTTRFRFSVRRFFLVLPSMRPTHCSMQTALQCSLGKKHCLFLALNRMPIFTTTRLRFSAGIFLSNCSQFETDTLFSADCWQQGVFQCSLDKKHCLFLALNCMPIFTTTRLQFSVGTLFLIQSSMRQTHCSKTMALDP